jgi:hypothetical protein
MISLFGVCSLTGWQLPKLLGSVLSSVELIALVIIYGALLPKSTAVSSATPFVDIEADIAALTPRITSALLVALAIQRVLLGSVSFDLGAVLIDGVAKAVTWLLAIETVRYIFAPSSRFCSDMSRLVNLHGPPSRLLKLWPFSLHAAHSYNLLDRKRWLTWLARSSCLDNSWR